MSVATSRWLLELRQALQSLARTPAFTATAVLTLGVGLGAGAAAYTLVRDIVLDPLGYPDAERLVVLRSEVPGVGDGAEWQASFAQYYQFRDNARTLAGIGLYGTVGMNVDTPTGADRVMAAIASADVQALIGTRAVLGRSLLAADNAPEAANVALISHGYWQRRFGGDPEVVGRTFRVSQYAGVLGSPDAPYEIVGVLAPDAGLPGMRGADADRADVWLPVRLDPTPSGGHSWSLLAKLAPGVSLGEAQAELDGLTRGLADSYPDLYSEALFENYGFRTRAYDLRSFVVGPVARNLWLIHGCVVLLLLAAVVNVASLFLVRAEARRGEMDVRLALGARRLAIFRLFAALSVTVALAGGALGLLAGHWAVAWTTLKSWQIPRMDQVSFDGGVFVVVLGLALVVALALAGYCALRVVGPGLAGAGRSLRGAVQESQRLRSAMIVAQVSVSLVLVVAAVLIIESFRNQYRMDTGIEAAGAVTIKTFHDRPDMSGWWPFVKEVTRRIDALPGVAAVGAATAVPFARFTGHGCTQQGFDDPAVHERVEDAGLTYCAAQAVATPGYFEATGIPMIRGRGFTDADLDSPSEGVVVVTAAFARRFWPGEDPLGKRVSPYGGKTYWYRVIGVAGDVYRGSVREEPQNLIYYPLAPIPGDTGWYFSGIDFVVRGDLPEPGALVPDVRRLIGEVDPSVVVGEVWTLAALVDRSMEHLGFTLAVVSAAAVATLGLAALGLYGVVAYLVARRTSEIGLRIALGASPGRVRGMVIARSLRLVALGLAIGLPASLAATMLLRSFVFGVTPTNPTAYALAVLLVTAVAALASWLATRSAARITPMDALRTE
ncbi:MAG: ADOP family duplicated permease [Gammaproteobacteria bacterium]|nr:ADOP family duplicated permease [Gammaproteobacteria bacterium]